MITKGKQKQPFAIIVAGQPGTGKSTFASLAPNPIFIPTEETFEIECDRYPIAKTYQDLIRYLNDSEVTKYSTIVIDAIDGVETLMHRYLLENDPKKSKTAAMAYGGYGNFYVEAQKLFETDIKGRLRQLREQNGMNIIIVAHTHKRTEVDPIMGSSYDTVSLNLHQKAQSVLVDWVSAVMFASFVNVKAETEGKGNFAIGTGERVLYTESRPGISVAKNRYNLPFEMPLDFSEFYRRYEDYYSDKKRPTAEILANIGSFLEQVTDDELKEKVAAALSAAGDDNKKLELLESRLRERVKQ